jgi:hypothetical protein
MPVNANGVYLEDMIKIAGKVLAYTDGLDQVSFVANGLTYDATLRNLELIVERLKLISQARATTLMTNFTKGDRVGFHAPDGRTLEGIVLRLNKKTVSVATDDGHQWNVAPGLLRLVQSAGDVQWP